MLIKSVMLENFRCFSEAQTVPLAPLTFLVGDNSTGKTSFLAAVRTLAQAAQRAAAPDFKAPPYDLGSYDEIAYSSGRGGSAAESFALGFEASLSASGDDPAASCRFKFDTTFVRSKHGNAPKLARRRFCWNDICTEQSPEQMPSEDTIKPEALRRAVKAVEELRLFASGPIRSRPQRTYDPIGRETDPEGDRVPTYLADLSRRNEDEWRRLKAALERFGRAAGLFDEIDVRRLGPRLGDPLQIQVRKYAGRRKGPFRNLIDVGYGISQVLPVFTELLRPDSDTCQFLLQQPEAHLHPSAQAALGTLFGNVAATGRQLIVETHSDYIVNRVRMDVRDGKVDLKPDDVALLYFERNGLDVRIHRIEWDDLGNVVDPPESYRQFFMIETHRSIGG